MSNDDMLERIRLHLNNALCLLNLKRRDIAELLGGAIVSNDISTLRAIGREIESAQAAIDAMQISVRDGFYIGGKKYKSLHDATIAAEPGDVIVVEGGSNKL